MVVYLGSQAEVDSFPINYTDLDCIGQLTISGDDISDLDSLYTLEYIYGDLYIGAEEATDPENPSENPLLTDLDGLSNLTNVNGILSIRENEVLFDISGLEQVYGDSLGGLKILNNPELSNCAIESVCDYIALDDADVSIADNMIWCFNEYQVMEACGPCPSNMVYFLQNQSMVDNFPVWYPECVDFEGWLWISGYDITNLDSLIQLNSVGLLDMGAFNVGNPLLENIDGLSNLTSLGGYLGFVENDLVTTLEPLSNVTDFSSTLFIYDNDNLTDLAGLEHADSVTTLIIKYNDGLLDLSGLDNVDSVRTLHINGNSSLSNLEGLGSLEIVVNLTIDSNNTLSNLDGVYNLDTVNSLRILNNHELLSLDGLDLEAISEGVEIIDNERLQNIEWLNGVYGGEMINLEISENDSLSFCSNTLVCEFINDNPGQAIIFDNAPGCNDEQEAEAGCATIGVDEVENELLRIYPNPANDKIYIDYPGEIEYVRVISISGKEIFRTGYSSRREEVDISSLAKGIYVLELSNGIREVFIKE